MSSSPCLSSTPPHPYHPPTPSPLFLVYIGIKETSVWPADSWDSTFRVFDTVCLGGGKSAIRTVPSLPNQPPLWFWCRWSSGHTLINTALGNVEPSDSVVPGPVASTSPEFLRHAECLDPIQVCSNRICILTRSRAWFLGTFRFKKLWYFTDQREEVPSPLFACMNLFGFFVLFFWQSSSPQLPGIAEFLRWVPRPPESETLCLGFFFSAFLPVSLSLPLSVSLHHILCPSVSDPPHLPISIPLMKKIEHTSQGIVGGGGDFNMGNSKETANRFLLVLLITFLTLESCILSCYLCSLFFFFNLQVFAIDYYHAISPWDVNSSLSKCQHKDQKSSKFAAIRRGCKFAVS